MNALLVADIGGTNARFGLMQKVPGEGANSGFSLSASQTLKCEGFASLAALIRAYCDNLDAPKPEYACLALAGPVKNNRVSMTNRNWHCSGVELEQTLGFSAVQLLNDYAALACAAPRLRGGNTETLFAAKPDSEAAIAVLGPGTGFGVAAFIPNALFPNQCGGQILPSEGGHVSFAPTTDLEIELLKILQREQKGHVSIENLVSGPGLVKLYRALARISAVEARFERPDQISSEGLSGADSLCRDALTLFCNILGGVAGDKALEFCALGGIYIGGGITPKLSGFLQQTDFLSRFQNKGSMSGFVRRIPIQLIKTDHAALIGCAAWLQNFIPD